MCLVQQIERVELHLRLITPRSNATASTHATRIHQSSAPSRPFTNLQRIQNLAPTTTVTRINIAEIIPMIWETIDSWGRFGSVAADDGKVDMIED